mgnify:CR=1 FL=1
MNGNINASGYNITATKFIGNLQGKAIVQLMLI